MLRHGRMAARLCYICAASLIVLTFAWPALGRGDAALCDLAAQQAARRHAVPLDVLRSVALLETGRTKDGTLRPWPWALNAGGTGYWLDSKADAATKAQAILATGRRNLDLGCFQINYRWHGQHFGSLDDMLDPAQGADYAARYLLQHYQRLGDWKAAIGAYHSRTPELAQAYLARYDRVVQAMGPMPTGATQTPIRNRPDSQNGFALLTGSGGGALGSLVPMSVLQGTGPLISDSAGFR
jgi:hypothetical protein